MLFDNESRQNNTQLSMWLLKRECFASETMSCWASYPGDNVLVNLNNLPCFGSLVILVLCEKGFFFYSLVPRGYHRYISFHHDRLSYCIFMQIDTITHSLQLLWFCWSAMVRGALAGLNVRRTPAHIDSDYLRISWLPELSPFPNCLMFSDLTLPASARPTESIPPSVRHPISLILHLPLVHLNNV